MTSSVRGRGAIAAMILTGLSLMGCAAPSGPMVASRMEPRGEPRTRVERATGQAPLQCVPYARANSAVKIFGDAHTWWDQAAGRYARTSSPAQGAVMVLQNYAGPDRGHVAVVSAMVGPREIRVDHANWFSDGSVYVNNPVRDVSAANDWSAVQVFNLKNGGWGSRTYSVRGFIGGTPLVQPVIRAPEIAPSPSPPREETPDETLLARIIEETARMPVAMPVAGRAPAGRTAEADDLNPPPGSDFALTEADLAIP